MKTTNRKLTLITTVLVTAVVFSTVPALALFDSGLGSLISCLVSATSSINLDRKSTM